MAEQSESAAPQKPEYSATLVIPTLERPEQLVALMKEVEQQSISDFETLIIDQSDVRNAEVESLCEQSEGRFRYLYLTRKSLPNARNVAAEHSSSPILIYIDDDVELAATFVESHVNRLKRGDVSAVAGRITGGYDDGPPGATKVGAFNRWLGVVTRNFHVTDEYQQIEQVPGGNFSVYKKVYLEVGGFHPDTFGGPASIGEETDFACRLRGAGHKIAFEPAAHLIHLHLPRGGCRDDNRTRWTYWHAHNMAVINRRHGKALAWMLFIPVQICRYFVHSLRHRSLSLLFAGLRGTFAGLLGHRTSA